MCVGRVQESTMKRQKRIIRKRKYPKVVVETEANAPCPRSIQRKILSNLRANAVRGIDTRRINRARELLERIEVKDSVDPGNNNEQIQVERMESPKQQVQEVSKPTVHHDKSIRRRMKQYVDAVAHWVKHSRLRGRSRD